DGAYDHRERSVFILQRAPGDIDTSNHQELSTEGCLHLFKEHRQLPSKSEHGIRRKRTTGKSVRAVREQGYVRTKRAEPFGCHVRLVCARTQRRRARLFL